MRDAGGAEERDALNGRFIGYGVQMRVHKRVGRIVISRGIAGTRMRLGVALFALLTSLQAMSLSAETLRIAALGDSLVHGYGLSQGQGFVPQLETWLRAQGREVKVLNAGVSGDTTAGGAARVEWTLADRPDGLLVLLGGNDLLRAIPPAQSRDNLGKILSVANARDIPVLLVGMTAPLNYGADYKAEFDALYSDLAAEYDALLHEDAFAGILAQTGGDMNVVRELMQPDNIHPNAEGVAANIAALGPKVLALLDRIEAQD